MKRKMKKVSAVLLITLLLCSGCGVRDKGGTGCDKLVLNEVAHSVFYAPMYVALEKDYFRDEKLQIELVTGFGADKTMTAVLTDEADIGFMGCESSIYTYQGGTKDYVVNFAQLTQRAGNFLVAREPMENFDWQDLKAKTVLGGRPGGMPEMIFEFILAKKGLIPGEDLTIDQSIDFGSTAAAFDGGQGDFTVEFEPHATLLEEQGKGYVVASLGEESGYVPYTSFCAKKGFMESHSKQIQGFTNAIQKGLDYVNSHSAEQIAKVIAPQFKEMKEDTLVRIVHRYLEQNTWKENLIFEQDSFELLQQILMDAGVLGEQVSYLDLVDVTFAEKAVEK